SSSRKGRTLPCAPGSSPAPNHRHSSPSGEINGTASGSAIARPRSETRVPPGSDMARAEACETVTLGVARNWRAVHQATAAPSAATSARMARAVGERATSAGPCAADHTKKATPMTGAAPIISRHFMSCVVPDIAPLLPVLAYPGIRAAARRRDANSSRSILSARLLGGYPPNQRSAGPDEPSIESRTPWPASGPQRALGDLAPLQERVERQAVVIELPGRGAADRRDHRLAALDHLADLGQMEDAGVQ